MARHDKTLEELREQVRRDESDLLDYESGVRQEYRLDGDKRINITDQFIARLRSGIARLNKLITSYEKTDA